MDTIMDNQWNLGLNLTLEEYETDNSTSDEIPSNFDWEFFHERDGLRMMGLSFGLVLGVFWPVIFFALLKLAGYAVIGLTLGYGREFVNSTFFQWSDEWVKNLEWVLKQENGGKLLYLFYVTSVILGCIVGHQFGSISVENHANFLEKSNLTWAEIQVEKLTITDTDYFYMIAACVIIGMVVIMYAIGTCFLFAPKRNPRARNDLSLSQETDPQVFQTPFQESQTLISNQETPILNSNQESQTPNSNQESPIPNSNQESQTPICNQETTILNSNQESQTPISNQETTILNSNQESQTPDSNQEYQTPNFNQESQTNEESIPIRTPKEYHAIWVENVNF